MRWASDLAVGDSRTVTIGAHVPITLADRTLTNTATVHGDQGDADPADDTATSATLVGPSADLQLVKSGPATSVAGTDATWTLEVLNRGPSPATGVTLTDQLPPGLTLVSAVPGQGTCDAGNPVTCALGSIPVGASVRVLVTARSATSLIGQEIRNTATVHGDQPDPDPANDVSSAGTKVVPVPNPPTPAQTADVAISKRAARARVRPGGSVRYTITIRNTGKVIANDVTFCDRLPASMAYVRATGAQLVRGNACWTVKRLKPGQRVSRSLTARVDRDVRSGTRLLNTAIVRGTNIERRTARARIVVSGRSGRHHRRHGITG